MDIIRRAAHLVDRLVIGVTRSFKSPMFSIDDRLPWCSARRRASMAISVSFLRLAADGFRGA
jgi:phosphopantetheine adenylyltransferase